MNPTLVALDSLDWSVGGGRHLTFEDRNRVELERSITLRESKELYPDHSDRVYMMAHFRRTNRFESKESLARCAAKWCEANLGECWMLMDQHREDLREILAYKGIPETRIRILNLIEEQSSKPCHWNWDSPTMDAFYSMWRAWKIGT